MITSPIWIKRTTTASNINKRTEISYKRKKWSVIISPNKMRLDSLNEYKIDDNGRDDKLEKTVNQITGHLRNLACISFGTQVKWGMEWGYTGTHVSDGALPYPSIHQTGLSENYTDEAIDKDLKMINVLGKNQTQHLPDLLNYWRRGFELDDLGFNAEAFLNYFKILEVFNEIGQSSPNSDSLKQRFMPLGMPQITLRKRFHASSPEEIRTLTNNIRFASKALQLQVLMKK